MKVLFIKKCSGKQLWYADFINCYAPYVESNNYETYRSMEPEGYTNVVWTGDADIVDIDNPVFFKQLSDHS